jgi:hypothetical protein
MARKQQAAFFIISSGCHRFGSPPLPDHKKTVKKLQQTVNFGAM